MNFHELRTHLPPLNDRHRVVVGLVEPVEVEVLAKGQAVLHACELDTVHGAAAIGVDHRK